MNYDVVLLFVPAGCTAPPGGCEVQVPDNIQWILALPRTFKLCWITLVFNFPIDI